MKKSEYEAARKEAWAVKPSGERSWSQCVRDDIAAAEAAGVVWDPEEKPLAERIWPVMSGVVPDHWLLRAKVDDFNDRPASYDELSIAADLYNRRHTFERIAQEMTALHDRCLEDEITRHSDEWLAAQLERWIAHLRSPIQ